MAINQSICDSIRFDSILIMFKRMNLTKQNWCKENKNEKKYTTTITKEWTKVQFYSLGTFSFFLIESTMHHLKKWEIHNNKKDVLIEKESLRTKTNQEYNPCLIKDRKRDNSFISGINNKKKFIHHFEMRVNN